MKPIEGSLGAAKSSYTLRRLTGTSKTNQTGNVHVTLVSVWDSVVARVASLLSHLYVKLYPILTPTLVATKAQHVR